MQFGDIQRRRGQGVPVTSKFGEQFAVGINLPGRRKLAANSANVAPKVSHQASALGNTGSMRR
jgi:hypothetical protein